MPGMRPLGLAAEFDDSFDADDDLDDLGATCEFGVSGRFGLVARMPSMDVFLWHGCEKIIVCANMRGNTNAHTDVVRVLMGLAMIGLGAYLFYTERKRSVNRRDWVIVVGAMLMVIGAIFGFGVLFGSIIIADDMLDWFK